MVFNCLCRHEFNDYWKYFEVLQMSMTWTSELSHIRVKRNHWCSVWWISFNSWKSNRSTVSTLPRTHFQLGHLHSLLVREQITESAAFFNLDDDFHPLERRGQHIICKLELIHIFSFHVNYLIYLSRFLVVFVAIHLTIIDNILKCYKWHNHT